MQFNFKPTDKEVIKHLWLITQLGLQFVANLVVFFLIFLYLDKLLSANNVLLALGIIIGVFMGFFNSYRILKKFYKNSGNDL